MRSFQDTAGRQWNVNITALEMKHVKESTGVSLTQLFADRCALFVELVEDVGKLVDVLWCVVRKQGDAAGVTPEQFAESIGNGVFADATRALAFAVADFYPPQQRDALHVMLDKSELASAAIVEAATAELQILDPSALVDRVLKPQEASA